MPLRFLAFSGSARRESLNRKLLAAFVAAVRAEGAEVTEADLNTYELPLYHGDLEEASGLPAGARRLISEIQQHDGLLIASPEYNSMMTPLLKNTLDWCTRGDDDPFPGQVVAVVSASPGQFGGIRSFTLTRQLLLHLGCYVVPEQCILPAADQAFDNEGRLTNPRTQKAVTKLARATVGLAGRLRREPPAT